MKTCTKCKQTKELSEYHKRTRSKDGYTTICKTCANEAKKEFHINNKERLCKKSMKYYNENSELIKKRMNTYKKKYYIDNKERILEESRTYYIDNIEKRTAQTAKYNKSDVGKMVAKVCLSKRRKRINTTNDKTINKLSLDNMMKKQNYRCFYCDNTLDFNIARSVHLDHVVPLSKGGTHSITNVVWSCASCNQHKSANIIS